MHEQRTGSLTGWRAVFSFLVTLILLVMTAIYSYFNRKESDWD